MGLRFILAFTLVGKFIFAQTPTWNNDVGSIFYAKCTSCHRTNGLGTFPIMSYNDVVSNIVNIDTAITNKVMPPWKPDPSYRHFKGETALKPEEINKIKQWIAGGMAQGAGNAPTPPTFNSASQLSSVDATISTLNYTITSNTDQYRTYVIHSNNTTDKYLNTVELLPGNNAVVHHIILFQDTSNISYNLDVADPAPGFASNGTMQQSPNASYVSLWAPGAGLFKMPDNMGIKIPAGSDFLIEIHYAPGHINESDSSVINLKYTNAPNIREVLIANVMDWGPSCLINFPLTIPANQIKSYKQLRLNNSGDASVLAIFPHMHKIGRSYKVYTTNTQGTDTVGYINIPDWDFHWQGFYMFQKPQKFALNEKIWGEVLYDNTTNNPDNPSNPPVTVFAGEQTTDEMMITFLAYTPYQAGDENIILDSTILANTINVELPLNTTLLYPNPTNKILHVANANRFNNYQIKTLEGRTVLNSNTFPIDVSMLQSGAYLITLIGVDKKQVNGKFIKE